MTVKVLMTAFIGSRNLGDEAIFKTILDHLEVERQQVVVLSIDEQKTRKLGVDTLFAKRVSDIVRAVQECDIVLVGGGGILQDQSSILNLLYFAFQIWLAKRYKKPTILCFVGVGPIRFGISKWLMKKLMPDVDCAIVRDAESKRHLLKYVNAPDRVHQAYDPVLNFSFSKSQLKDLYKDRRPYVVMSLRRWFFVNPLLPTFVARNLSRLRPFRQRYGSYMRQLATDLDHYLDRYKDTKIVAVSLYDGEDDIVNKDLLALMRNSERVIVAPSGMDELQYLSIVKDCEFVIGMRLHSLILSSTLSKPFVALRYSGKVDEFTEQMGLTDLSVDIEQYDSVRLSGGLRMITSNPTKYEERVTTALEQYQTKNREAFKLLNARIRTLTTKPANFDTAEA